MICFLLQLLAILAVTTVVHLWARAEVARACGIKLREVVFGAGKTFWQHGILEVRVLPIGG